MKTLLKSAIAAAALAASASVAQAYRGDLSAFDAAQARSPAERLVLCDTTAFLATRPNLEANRIYARREGRPWQLMIGPRFVQGGQLYSERYDRMYWKLKRDSQIDQNQLVAAQDGPGRALVEGYRDGGYLPMAFAREQQKFCDAWTHEAGVRGPV
jgi:hypothetical protein